MRVRLRNLTFMEDSKSYCSVYTELFTQLYQDIAGYTNQKHRVQRDEVEIRRRIEHEGLSFLTKTLPSYGKLLDRSLVVGELVPHQGLSKVRGSTLPNLFGWLYERIFQADGCILPLTTDVCVAIQQLRQLYAFAYKLEVPSGDSARERALSQFIRNERDLALLDLDIVDQAPLQKARTFISRVFAGFDPRDIVPTHGPGAVSTGERIHEKSFLSRVFTTLDTYFPFTEYMMFSVSHVVDRYPFSTGDPGPGTAKVVLVPKDSRGPRIISCEPLEYQWIQQGIRRKLYPYIESHRWLRGHVNFTDQEINRQLALEGSRTQKWVTLDMKDASDRVSLELVERLFSGSALYDALYACRTRYTRLPSGELVHMAKFAPMGSALCFPIEALCFYALAVAVISIREKLPLRLARELVYVYGDDLIVDAKVYRHLEQYFPQVGLKFNESKCCTAGLFRESCGLDAYGGVDVTPVRMRTVWGKPGTKGPNELASWVSLSNSLHVRGYWSASEYIRNMVISRYGYIPYVPYAYGVDKRGIPISRDQFSHSQVIGFYRPHVNDKALNRKAGVKYRFKRDLFRLEIRGLAIKPVQISTENDDWEELLRRMNAGSSRCKVGDYPIARRSCLKRAWGSV